MALMLVFVLAEMRPLFRFDDFYLVVVDRDQDILDFRAHEQRGEWRPRQHRPLGSGLFGWVVESGEALLIENWAEAPESLRERAEETGKVTGSVIAILRTRRLGVRSKCRRRASGRPPPWVTWDSSCDPSTCIPTAACSRCVSPWMSGPRQSSSPSFPTSSRNASALRRGGRHRSLPPARLQSGQRGSIPGPSTWFFFGPAIVRRGMAIVWPGKDRHDPSALTRADHPRPCRVDRRALHDRAPARAQGTRQGRSARGASG